MMKTHFKRMILSLIGFFIFSACYSSYILAWPWDKPKAKTEEKKIPQPLIEELSVNEAESSYQEREPALYENLAEKESVSGTDFGEANQSDQELKESTWVETTEETQAGVAQPIQTSVQPVKIYPRPAKIFRPVQRIQPAFQLPLRPVAIVRPVAGGTGSATPSLKGSFSEEKKLKGKTKKNQKEE